MTTVVVGGSGFLGRHICAALTARNVPVLAVARRPVPGVRSVTCDVSDEPPATLTRLVTEYGARVVVNAAGAVWSDDQRTLDIHNAQLVERLCDAMSGVPYQVRLVQLGTVFEYAPPEHGQPLTEDSPLAPVSAYGRSKLRGSRTVLDATRSGLLDGVVLRPTTCAGAGAGRAGLFGRVAGELRAAAARGTPATIRLAPLTAQRDFVDCRDLADAVVSATTARVVGRVVNVGSGTAVGVRHAVDLLIAASGVPATLVEEERPRGRSADVHWLAAHPGLARRVLGWRPRHSLASTARAIWNEATTNVAEGPD